MRESNSRPLAPEARIIPLDQSPTKKKAPEVRLELTTYRLTAGRATDCAIQEPRRVKKWIQHHTVPGWSPTPVLSGLKPR